MHNDRQIRVKGLIQIFKFTFNTPAPEAEARTGYDQTQTDCA